MSLKTYPSHEEAHLVETFQNDLYSMMTQLVENVNELARKSRTTTDRGHGMCEAERAILSGLLGIGQRVLEHYVAEVGPGDEPELAESCHRRVLRSTRVLSVFGEVAVSRFIYYTEGGERVVPTAAALNLPDRQASYFVQQLLGRLALEQTYESAVGFFEELFGRRLSTHTADEIVAEQARYTPSFNAQLALPELPADDEIQVVSLDGKGVPIIKPEHCGHQPPRLKQGEKRQRKREALVGVEYTVKRHLRSARAVALSLVRPDLLNDDQRAELRTRERARDLHYEASILDKASVPHALEHRLERKRQAGSTADTVCLIDGSAHLARLATDHFGTDVPIVLDIIHVSEYLWQAAYAVHGSNADAASITVVAWLVTILEGRVGHVIGGLKQRRDNLKGNQRKALQTTITYLDNHRVYMRYHDYLACGYPIGTGVIESACGHLVKNRMEKAGARWSPQGAEAMLRLRAIHASGDYQDYLDDREHQEHQRLYQRTA